MIGRIVGATVSGILTMSVAFSAQAQTVVDANGKKVGALYDYSDYRMINIRGDQYILRKMTSRIWVSVPVVAQGFCTDLGELEYFYTSPNCTGPAYTIDDDNRLVQNADFFPADKSANCGTDGVLIYAGEPRARLLFNSHRIKYAREPDGSCSSRREDRYGRPVIEFNTKSLGLKAPFQLK